MRFVQSRFDFPLMVRLGEETPVWGLDRWGKKGLRFVPPDDEGFTLRGNSKRLVYKGRRRSHRFTILGNDAFEYDCILKREPECNVIALRMEGAEQFNFFRQPDFIQEPLVAGSYAVYKKQTLLGEGTGKLCHIHRPEIIDAKGRRCWGDLSVVDSELRITIPEHFLSEAVYPVIVDPIVGSTTIGKQCYIQYDYGEPPLPLRYEVQIPVNRFILPEHLNGECSAFFYVNGNLEEEAGGRAVMYSDYLDMPMNRLSKKEQYIDFRYSKNNPVNLRIGTFDSKGFIAAGTPVWFGACTDAFWYAYYDYGSRSFDAFYDSDDGIPDVYPRNSYNVFADLQLSMFLYYEPAASQHYVRTVQQPVVLFDVRSETKSFRRILVQPSMAVAFITGQAGLCRYCLEFVRNDMRLGWSRSLVRVAAVLARAVDDIKKNLTYKRVLAEKAMAELSIKRFANWFRALLERSGNTGTAAAPVLFIRSVSEKAGIAGHLKYLVAYCRGLYSAVESSAPPPRYMGNFFRLQTEAVTTGWAVIRRLGVVALISSGLSVIDLIVSRFIKSKSVLILKSCITREIILDSKIK